jgi:uncharacterized membrane protein
MMSEYAPKLASGGEQLNEQLERQNALNRAIIAMAYAPAFSVAPLLVAELIADYAGLNTAGQQLVQRLGFTAIFLMIGGLMYMAFTTIYALTIFFRAPKLSLGRPIPKRILWALIAIASPLICYLGLLNRQLHSNDFRQFMGIDVLSSTLIYGSILFYIYALIKVIREKPKDV